MLIAGKLPRLAREWATELLDAVGLSERRHHRLSQLSGGQQQRVAIALALANSPQLLLADEPTGEMDSATARAIWESFRQLNARYGLTTIIVTHDPKIAQEVDRVVSIRDGKTSTETVRQAGPREKTMFAPGTRLSMATTSDLAPATEAAYEEYVVLDAAGRLQVPRDYLAEWGIGSRAKLELHEDGILIKPINGGKPAVPVPIARGEMPRADGTLYAIEDEPPQPAVPSWRRKLGGVFGRPPARKR
jgi:putative ABC transport system ATP-binding protein